MNNIEIIDCHVHVTLYNETFQNKDFTIEKVLKQMDLHGISKSIVMLNPMLKEHTCNTHKRKVFDSDKSDELVIKCLECSKILYRGADPLRNLNIDLIKNCQKHNDRLIPLLYMYSSNNTMQNEIDFFEKNYHEAYMGYKFNPAQSFRRMNEINFLKSKKTILIHAGKNCEHDHVINTINFAKNYSGNVVLAHACRFSANELKEIAKTDNIFVDLSPFCIMHDRKETDLFAPYNVPTLSKDDLYNALIQLVGIDKILFGSDAPFSEQGVELASLLNSSLSENEKTKILNLNFKQAFT
jgi:predicted TIM-barrel fold metal-dependent hydrolase